jgi:predicted amidohydrolase
VLRVGFYQFRPVFGAVEKNLSRVLRALEGVSADLLVLPELPFTGYYFKDRAEVLALGEDPQDSKTVEALVALCRRRDFHLVTGFCERHAGRVYNSALLIGPLGIEHHYRKLHLFNEEKRCFDPGDLPLSVQEVRGAQVGLMVCFDWAFPEVARSLTLQGAEVLCHPANLVLGHCQQAMLTRALENHVYAVTANRYGADARPHGRLRFTGRSQIAAPGGRLLYRAPASREVLYVTEIDPAEARDKRITPCNDLIADRRPECYLEGRIPASQTNSASSTAS